MTQEAFKNCAPVTKYIAKTDGKLINLADAQSDRTLFW